MSVAELKRSLTDQLASLGEKMDQYQKLELAFNMKISIKTVERYTSGDITEVRKLEFAEEMIEEAGKVLAKVADKTTDQQ